MTKKIIVKSTKKGYVKLEYIGDDNMTFDKLQRKIEELESRIEDKQRLKS